MLRYIWSQSILRLSGFASDQEPVEMLIDDGAAGAAVILAPTRTHQTVFGLDLDHTHRVVWEPARQRMSILGVSRHGGDQLELILPSGEVAPKRRVNGGHLHSCDLHCILLKVVELSKGFVF